MNTKYIVTLTGKKFSGKWEKVRVAFNAYALSKGHTIQAQGTFGWVNEKGEVMTLSTVK